MLSVSIVVMLFGISQIGDAAPNCNSITIGDISFPTGACQMAEGVSYSFECNGGVMYQNFYANSGNCSTYPISFPACSMMEFDIDSTEVQCDEICDQQPCTYTNIVNYADLECSTSIVASIPIIMDYCHYGAIYSCDDNGIIVNELYMSSDCSGDPIITHSLSAHDCSFGTSFSGCTPTPSGDSTPSPAVDAFSDDSASSSVDTSSDDSTPSLDDAFDDFIETFNTPSNATVYNDLMCDGAVIGFGGFMEMALPAGVCTGSDHGSGSSAIAVCENGRPMLYNYSTSSDCSGTPSEIIDGCESILEMEYDIDGTDIPIELGFELTCTPFCSVVPSPCDIFIEREYFNADRCNGDEAVGNDMYYEEYPEIIGYCAYNAIHGGAMKYENNQTHILLLHYYSNADCLGSPDYTEVYGMIGSVCEKDGFGNVSAKVITTSKKLNSTIAKTNGSKSLSLSGLVHMQIIMILCWLYKDF